MEAGQLVLYKFFASVFATSVHHPASPIRHFVASGVFRRALLGSAMGAAVVAFILTPWARQSGGLGLVQTAQRQYRCCCIGA
jgi:aquaporin Z